MIIFSDTFRLLAVLDNKNMFVRMSKRTLTVTGIGRQKQKQQSQLLRQILMLSTDSKAAKCVEASNKARRKLPTGGPGISQFITDLGRFRKSIFLLNVLVLYTI